MKGFKVVRGFSCILAAFILLFTGIVSSHAATITVAAVNADTLNTNGSCSLREAITNINNGALTYADCPNTGAAYGTSDTINIPAGTYTTTIAGAGEDSNATGDYDILKSVAIVGAGASTTTINGGGLDRVFHINPAGAGGVIVSFSGLTITGGNTAQYGGGIYNIVATLNVTNSTISGNTAIGGIGGGDGGGGIWSDTGTVTITNSTISNNTAPVGITGGGIYLNSGTLGVTNSTISGNTTTAGFGGGIFNNGNTLTVTNSTITGNSAKDWGGGIFNNAGSALTVTNSTITSNSTTGGAGGGILNSGTVTLSNTIVANQTLGANCDGVVVSSGHNLESANSCLFAGVGDLINTNPLLGALASNGGPTQTMALLAGSPAIDAGDNAICAAAPVSGVDQWGTVRPQGATCDIGAYEYIVPVTTPVSVPTMNEWGMMIFMLLAGLGSMYYMRRRA